MIEAPREGRQRVELPEDLELMAPGPELCALLASVSRGALSDRDRVRLLRARNRLVAHMQGELFADLYAVSLEDEPDEEAMARYDAPSRYPWAQSEVAFALTWTETAAGARLEQARQLAEELPQVFDALRAGSVDMPKVLVICELAGWLDDREAAGRLVDAVIDRAPELTTGQLRAKLRQLVLAVDPQAVRRRCARALTTRRVESFPNHDGTGELWGRSLPPQDAAAAWERLTAIARAAKAAGDDRTMDQLRADALLDLLVGEGIATGGPVGRHIAGLPDADGHPDIAVDSPATSPATSPAAPTVAAPAGPAVGAMPAPRRGTVELLLPLSTATGQSDLPGELVGWGPVIADIARHIAAEQRDAQWRFSAYNRLGELEHHGITTARPPAAAQPAPAGAPLSQRRTSRRPAARVAAFVTARNRTCTAPGCRIPARSCDLDHTVEWSRGGESTEANLGPGCRRHHMFKHESGASVWQLDPGDAFVWTTRRGMQYLTKPDPPLLTHGQLFSRLPDPLPDPPDTS